MTMIRSEWLTAFIGFAEELNFTRAAARMHLSQPAFHVQIRRLSEAMGVTLYERRGRNLVLTPHGRELLAFARDSRDRTAAVSRHRYGINPVRMAFERVQCLAALQERQPLVIGSRDSTVSIGRHHHGFDPVRMAFKCADRLAVRQVPEPQSRSVCWPIPTTG